jgi:hypothetical protein
MTEDEVKALSELNQQLAAGTITEEEYRVGARALGFMEDGPIVAMGIPGGEYRRGESFDIEEG